MKKNVLAIRADGNEKIGLGHIMRTMTIASVFRSNGFECFFICSAPVNQWIFERYSYECVKIDYPYDNKSLSEAFEISELLIKRSVDFLLVDSYYINNEYLEILRKTCSLICINSTRNRLATDYLINENIACDKDYFDQLYMESGTKLLLGERYSPIRSEFYKRNYLLKQKVKRILITTGGGDQYNFMTEFIRKIANQEKYCGLYFMFVSGGCNAYYDDLKKEVQGLKNLEIINNAMNMAELMETADLAISAGGTTVLELSVIGVPTIGIAVADDQVAGLSAMHCMGMIRYAGRITESDFWDNVSSYFELLVENEMVRIQLSEQSKKYIDSKGASRIYDKIVKDCNSVL